MIALVNIDIFEDPVIIRALATQLYEILLKEKTLRNGLIISTNKPSAINSNQVHERT
jgi:hypothetical protein